MNFLPAILFDAEENAGLLSSFRLINYQQETMNCRVVCLGGPKSLGVRHRISNQSCSAVQGPTHGRFRSAFIARASEKEGDDMYEYGKSWV